MSEPLADDALAAMIARDDAAGDGHVVPDDLVFTDRHLLIGEVQRQRELIDQLRGESSAAVSSPP